MVPFIKLSRNCYSNRGRNLPAPRSHRSRAMPLSISRPEKISASACLARTAFPISISACVSRSSCRRLRVRSRCRRRRRIFVKFFDNCRTNITYVSPTRHSEFPNYKGCNVGGAHHLYAGTFQNQRSFHGIGPALSWNASLPILGEPQTGALNVDWGANAALLFGRQRANGSHHTSAYYKVFTAPSVAQTQHTSVGGFNRSRAIIVPNIGGFAGLSFSFTTVKVSAGYRGDFFFGAMDTGNDMRKTKTVGFYGPFATISFGIGG